MRQQVLAEAPKVLWAASLGGDVRLEIGSARARNVQQKLRKRPPATSSAFNLPAETDPESLKQQT